MLNCKYSTVASHVASYASPGPRAPGHFFNGEFRPRTCRSPHPAMPLCMKQQIRGRKRMAFLGTSVPVRIKLPYAVLGLGLGDCGYGIVVRTKRMITRYLPPRTGRLVIYLLPKSKMMRVRGEGENCPQAMGEPRLWGFCFAPVREEGLGYIVGRQVCFLVGIGFDIFLPRNKTTPTQPIKESEIIQCTSPTRSSAWPWRP